MKTLDIHKIADLQDERDQLLAIVATDTTALYVLQREHAELQHIAIQVAAERDALRGALDRAATMLERVTRRGAFVVGCDAAAKVARAALASGSNKP